MSVANAHGAPIGAMEPARVAAYLRLHGWNAMEELGPRAAVWSAADLGFDREALLPLDMSLGDYGLRMSEVLAAIESVEGRSQLAIFNDIARVGFDVLRFGLIGPNFADGTIPLEVGSELIGQARESALAGACAALHPRAVFSNRKPQRALDYVRGLRLGQTEVGSYVLTLQSPVAPAPAALALWPEPESVPVPFERRAFATLQSAAAAIGAAATQAVSRADFGGFDAAIEAGVSANLLEALGGILNLSDAHSLNLDFRPSAAFGQLGSPVEVRFDMSAGPILQEAARQLRAKAPIDEFEVNGYVIGVKKEPEVEIGAVTVAAHAEGRLRNIRMELRSRAYHVAVRAHDEEQPVRCIGQLEREGRGYRLSDVTAFDVLGPAEIDQLSLEPRMELFS